MPYEVTRRQVLRTGAAAGALAALEAISPAQVLERVLAAPACGGTLADIEHVVIFINENRSFDSYFGTYRGVRGFGDPTPERLNDGSGLSVFAQPWPGTQGVPYGGHLLPFHFDTNKQGECVNDISHEWAVQHLVWNNGAMDSFVSVHETYNLPRDATNTMGYYDRADLPFYHALADAFTICDGYYCSVIGPTDPNRLYSISASLGEDGTKGGPILSTSATRRERFGTLSWETMPERLNAHGVTWKVYGTPDGHYGDNVLPYFKNYQQDPNLAANALLPSFPAEFQADCAAGTLPQVSWVLASLLDSEHPPAPITYGEAAAAQVLSALTSNPAVWAKSALFITYDENGGFFDHVPPPVPPPGTPGEFLTAATLPPEATPTGSTTPIRGPVGLGFRVPLLVVSPLSRGGLVCSDTFDHTSLMRFLETRFGAEVPNLSAWRRSVTGDLTSAFNFAAKPDAAVPSLPSPSRADPRVLGSDCPTQAPDTGEESFPTVVGYPVPPPPQRMPAQEPGAARRPSGLCGPAGPAPGAGGSGEIGGFQNGVVTPSNPLGLPSTRGCVDTRRFAFVIHRPHGRRITRVDAFINGRHVKTVKAAHGGNVSRMVLPRVPIGTFTLRIEAHTANGHTVVSVRQYHGCTKGAPHTLHRRAHRKRKHAHKH
jgi:phospholipase C